MLFNFFITYQDDGMELTLRKLSQDVKLGWFWIFGTNYNSVDLLGHLGTH